MSTSTMKPDDETPVQDRIREIPSPLEPGTALASLIADVAAKGRRAWQIGPIPGCSFGLYLPRPPVQFTAAPSERLLPQPGRVPTVLVPRQLLIMLQAISSGDGPLVELLEPMLKPSDHKAGRRLHAAALRDVVGLDWDAIGEICGFADDADGRSAREDARRGRPMWAALKAWPWLEFRDRGATPPEGWRNREISDERLLRSLDAWITGTLRPRDLCLLPPGRAAR